MQYLFFRLVNFYLAMQLLMCTGAISQPLFNYEKFISTSSSKSKFNIFPGNIKCDNGSYAGNTSKTAISVDSGNPDYAIVSDFDSAAQYGKIKKINLNNNSDLLNFSTSFNKYHDWPAYNPFILSNSLTSGVEFGSQFMLRDGVIYGAPWMLAAIDDTTPVPKYPEHTKNLIAYIGGSQPPVITNGISDNYFVRSSDKLGMIVNSAPWIQRAPASKIAYGNYSSFKTQYAKRRDVVWVGANDGMLHGFYADNGDFLMSYLPSPLFNRLYASVQLGRMPEALMDGSPFTADIGFDYTKVEPYNDYIFRTYLFSSMGRGGKAFFALDVTDPSTLMKKNSSDIFKWIFSDADDVDLGYIIGNNVIHPLSNQPVSSVLTQNNRDFGLLIPNGIDSTNNNSVLYIIFSAGPELFNATNPNPTRDPAKATHQYADAWIKATTIEKAARYIKLVAPKSADTNNGLVGVTWVAASITGEAAYVYATDLNGKLWKFNVNNSNFTYWQGFEGISTDNSYPSAPTLVFDSNEGRLSTGPILKITTAPILRYDTKGRVNIIFGTGSALTGADFQDTSAKNRIYSIIDTPSATSTYKHASLSTRNLSEIDTMTYISDSSDVSSSNGWVVYFRSSSGEKVINNPVILGDTIFVNTSAPLAGCVTQARVYAIDASTGKANSTALGTASVTINNVTKEVNALAIKSKDQSTVVFTQPDGLKNTVQIVGKSDNIKGISYYATNRQQWRTIPGMKSTQ